MATPRSSPDSPAAKRNRAHDALDTIVDIVKYVWRIDAAASDPETVILQREAIEQGVRRQVAVIRGLLRDAN